MNSSDAHILFAPPSDGREFDFGGVARSLQESDMIVVDSTFNVIAYILSETNSSGLVLASAGGRSNINVTNCDVNYSIMFREKRYAASPGVLGHMRNANMTLVLNVSARLYVNNTKTPGSGFIATGLESNFTVVNTTADITLKGDSRGTGFLGYMELNYSCRVGSGEHCHKFDGNNMTFVNYTGRSDVSGQHRTGNIAGKINYYSYVHLVNITVMGRAYASVEKKEPRCEGIVIGHVYDVLSALMYNVSVPQARILSRQYNVGVQGLLMGAHGPSRFELKNWTIGFAERVFVQGNITTSGGGVGTLFAYAEMGTYEVENVIMHTRYSNIPAVPADANPVMRAGGICGHVKPTAKLFIRDVVIDFLSTDITNAGLIAGTVYPLGVLQIHRVRSETNRKYARARTANLYRCVYNPLANLTILDYNLLPYGESHDPLTHMSSCRYKWLLPFAEARYHNQDTMTSPIQSFDFSCKDLPQEWVDIIVPGNAAILHIPLLPLSKLRRSSRCD